MSSNSQLFNLLRFYGHIRTVIFTLLSPSDIMSLCNASGFVLDSVEKLRYTDPLLELFYDLDWTKENDKFTRCDIALTGDDLFTITKPTHTVKNICMAVVRQCKGNCSDRHYIAGFDSSCARPNVYIREVTPFYNELHEIDFGINVYITCILRCNYDDKDSRIGNINEVLPSVCSEVAKFSTVPSIDKVEYHEGTHSRTCTLFHIPTYLSAYNRPTIKMSRITVVLIDRPGFEFLRREVVVISVDPYSPLAPALLGKSLNSMAFHCSEII